MSHADELKKIWTEAIRLSEQAEQIAQDFAAMRQAATDKGFDWSQIKSLARAHVKDAEDGKERVRKIVNKAGFACEYAGILHLSEPERKVENRSSIPAPHNSGGTSFSNASPPKPLDAGETVRSGPDLSIPVEPADPFPLITDGEGGPESDPGLAAGSSSFDATDIRNFPKLYRVVAGVA